VRDDTDDALDALFRSKKRKIKEETENVGCSSTSVGTDYYGSTAKAKADGDHWKTKTNGPNIPRVRSTMVVKQTVF
jgi:hypothetical protein